MNKYLDSIIKIFLILLGLADFFSILPPSLDLFDKFLTSIILVYFWFKLKPTLFMFGKKSLKLDIAIITTYYILVLNTFLRFLMPLFSDNTFALISEYVNMFSLVGGMILLLLLTIYISLYINIGIKSVAHSIISIFDKDNKFFDKIKGKKIGFHTPIEFILNFSILYSIGIYFFSLINQWFVVSLDKSLLILAIIYSVKDLEKSKIKALNSIGEFDDKILATVTDLFTTPNKFYLAFGFLLIFHYLSDIGTFFISYISHIIPIDTIYYALGESSHYSLFHHFTTEVFTSFFNYISIVWTYIFSGLGVILLLLIPIIIMFFIIYKIDLRSLTYNKRYRFFLSIIALAIIIFLIAPWTTQLSIANNELGIIGVDFITHRISDNTSFIFEGIFIASIILLYFLNTIKKYKELTTVLYITSMFYLAIYVWNYFLSSFGYYTSLISHFIIQKNNFLVANFILLLTLDFLFYICGAILLFYYTFNYIIKSLLRDIITDKLIIIWTIILIILPQILIYNGQISLASIIITTLFVFTFAMFKELTGKEYRDDYILGVNMVIASYQLLLLIIIALSPFILEKLLIFLSPFFILITALIIKNFFKLKQNWKLNTKKTLIAITTGILFGYLFFLTGETPPGFTNIILIVIYTLGIGFAEEIMFRLIIYKLAKKAFSYAIYIQAFVFMLIHILAKPLVWSSIIYMILLYIFAIIAAKMVKENNISHAIIFHFITNLTMILISIS